MDTHQLIITTSPHELHLKRRWDYQIFGSVDVESREEERRLRKKGGGEGRENPGAFVGSGFVAFPRRERWLRCQ